LAKRFQDLVLGSTIGPSSLALAMSMVVEQLKGRINAAAANRACWGSRSTLVAIVLHFWELEAELVVLGFGRSADLTDDKAGVL
jgi:hypothetical protein